MSAVHEKERLSAAVVRTLTETCGIEGREPHQLHAFDEPDREELGWTLVVAHVLVVPAAELLDAVAARDDLTLAPINPPGEDAGPAEIADVIRFPTWALHTNHPTLEEWGPDADPDVVGRAALAQAPLLTTEAELQGTAVPAAIETFWAERGVAGGPARLGPGRPRPSW